MKTIVLGCLLDIIGLVASGMIQRMVGIHAACRTGRGEGIVSRPP
jgi:hypothetical protein